MYNVLYMAPHYHDKLKIHRDIKMGLPYIIVTFCALNIFVILIFLTLLRKLIMKNFHLLTVLQCTYSFPYGVVTEETAYLSKRHWPLSPGVLPTRKVMDTQLIDVGLIQLPKRREERRREGGGEEREGEKRGRREGGREGGREREEEGGREGGEKGGRERERRKEGEKGERREGGREGGREGEEEERGIERERSNI